MQREWTRGRKGRAKLREVDIAQGSSLDRMEDHKRNPLSESTVNFEIIRGTEHKNKWYETWGS